MGFGKKSKSKGTVNADNYLQFLTPLHKKKTVTVIEQILNGTIQMIPPVAFPADFLKDDNYRIVADLSNDDYHAMTEYDSSSRIKSIFKTELNYWNYGSGSATNSQNLGTCIHIVFEDLIGNECNDIMSCLDMWNVKETKTTCIPETRTIARPYFELLQNLLIEIERVGLLPVLKCCFSEVSFFDEVSKQRVRPDIWLPLPDMQFDYMISIKSVSNVAKFKYQINSFSYDLSEGMYMQHMEKALHKPIRTAFLLVDTSNNGMIQFIELSDDTIERYIEKYEQANKKIKAIDKDNVKGYPTITI